MIGARFNTNTNKARHHAIIYLHHSLNQVAGGKIFKNVLKFHFLEAKDQVVKIFSIKTILHKYGTLMLSIPKIHTHIAQEVNIDQHPFSPLVLKGLRSFSWAA